MYTLFHTVSEGVEFYAARGYVHLKKDGREKYFFFSDEDEKDDEVLHVGRQLKARSVSFIKFLVTSRVLKINNPYVHKPSLQASKASKLHIRGQPKVHHEDRSAANSAPF